MSTDKPFDLTTGQPYQFRNYRISLHMNAGLDRYIKIGQRPGDFLFAVLKNDFIGAVSRADPSNILNLTAFMGFMCNEMPGASYGSPAKVKAWCKLGGLEGQQAAEDKINHYDETRPLADGSIKNTLTGEVTQPTTIPKTKYGENK